MSPEDKKLLGDLLAWLDEHDPDGDRFNARPFQEMLDRGFELSEKQRAWARGLYAKCTDTPVYENLVSRGLVPRGREVPTPEILKKLPLKPPARNPTRTS